MMGFHFVTTHPTVFGRAQSIFTKDRKVSNVNYGVLFCQS